MANPDNRAQFLLRLPPKLLAALRAAAKNNDRSANAEMIARLEKSKSEFSELEQLKARVARLEKKEQ